jgi:hypothetical protein
LTMKKHYEVEHSNIFKTYVIEIIQWWHCTKTNDFAKQSSKVWKVVTPRSISTYFNNITTSKKSNEEQKAFFDDLVLVVMKGLFPLTFKHSQKHMDEVTWLTKGPMIVISIT